MTNRAGERPGINHEENPMTTMQHPDIIIDTYSRADALADGTLVDITPVARKIGFKHPVAVTEAVWLACVNWTDEIESGKAGFTAQDTDGRTHDVVWAAFCAARRGRGAHAYFTVSYVPVEGAVTRLRESTLLMTIGGGDQGEPVITIGFPEDF